MRIVNLCRSLPGAKEPVFSGVRDDGLVGMSAHAMYSRPFCCTESVGLANFRLLFQYTLSVLFHTGRGGAS
jgi:hypothetical protein